MDSTFKHKPSTIRNLSKNLKKRIFGQDHIIDAVVNTININMAGLGDTNKPIASFLFSGPTGVGKTELAKELAKLLNIHFERFDMSEYADEYSARNLTGGQMGLVGYEDGGLLTNAIKENPNCVLLLDEIEKADKAVYNTFLQVLDYGKLTDTKGNTADFSNTIIILTSNLGSTEKRGIGFGENHNTHKESAVKDYLTPEFRNRIDKMLEFKSLDSDMAKLIIDKYLSDFAEILEGKRISIEVTEKAKILLNTVGFDSGMGARSVLRSINNNFKQKISNEILFGELSKGGKVIIDVDGNSFKYIFVPLEKIKNIPSDTVKEYKDVEKRTVLTKYKDKEKEILKDVESEAEKVEILLYAFRNIL